MNEIGKDISDGSSTNLPVACSHALAVCGYCVSAHEADMRCFSLPCVCSSDMRMLAFVFIE